MRTFLFLSILIYSSVLFAEPTKILEMRRLTTPDSVEQIIFDLSAPLKHQLFTLPKEKNKPHRVVLDLESSQLVGDLIAAKTSVLLQDVRSAKRNKDDLRIVFDLTSPVDVKAFLLKPAGRYGHRLVLTLEDPAQGYTEFSPSSLTELAAMPLQIPPELTKLLNKPAPKPSVSRKKRPPAPPQVAVHRKPKRTIPPPIVMANTRPTNTGRYVTVAIDAGHGGLDPGASGKRGTREKNVVLQISKELARLVDTAPGMNAALIRDGDYFLSLRQRIQRAREAQADIFISIHADAYEADASPLSGASVYMLSQKGASSEAAKWLAERENGADLLGGVSLNDKSNILASILLDLSQTGTLDASAQLGNKVLAQLGSSVPLYHRKVQRAAFMVLRSPDIPSILVETAFISNPSGERKLLDKAWQRKIAYEVFQGISSYFNEHAPPDTLLARQ